MTGRLVLRSSKARQRRRTAIGVCLCVAAIGLLTGTAPADGKKLEVIVEHSTVHLDPDGQSPVVEILPKGTIISLASPVRMKKLWLYISFTSFRNGSVRSGYVPESEVRKLFPVLNVVQISSEDEILDPKAIDLTSPVRANLEWGITKESIIRTEGKPNNQTMSGGLEVLEYRRELMNKKCLVEYILDRNRLVTARINLLENYADKNRYLDDYDKIRGFMTAKVGEPRSNKTTWQGKSQPTPTQGMGDALSKGEVEFSSEWVFGDTSVHIVLCGGNNRVSFGAELVDIKSRNSVSY